MTTHPLTVAMNTAEAVFEVKRGGPFRRAVGNFAHVLRTVPDYPVAEISRGSIQVLQYLSERVIEQVERRLAEGGDRLATQQNLAAAIYDIRSALEVIDRWQRHSAAPALRASRVQRLRAASTP